MGKGRAAGSARVMEILSCTQLLYHPGMRWLTWLTLSNYKAVEDKRQGHCRWRKMPSALGVPTVQYPREEK